MSCLSPALGFEGRCEWQQLLQTVRSEAAGQVLKQGGLASSLTESAISQTSNMGGIVVLQLRSECVKCCEPPQRKQNGRSLLGLMSNKAVIGPKRRICAKAQQGPTQNPSFIATLGLWG